MNANYVDGKGFDWQLSDGQKRLTTWLFGALSFCAWLLYSTPATINVGVKITQDVSILGITESGFVIGVIGAFIVSAAEYAFLMLAVWKNWLYMIPCLVCGIISIMGTVLFLNIGEQKANIKRNEITTIEKSITDKEQEAEITKQRIEDYQHKIDNPEDGKRIPTWIYTRLREAEEKLTAINDSLTTMRRRKSIVEKKHGAIVTINGNSDGNKNASIGFAIFIEMVVIGCGILAVGIKQSNTNNDERYIISTNGKLVLVDKNNTCDEKRVVNQVDNLVDKRFGFQTGQNAPDSKSPERSVNVQESELSSTEKSEIPKNDVKSLQTDYLNTGKSDATILYIWDNGIETRRDKIGELAGQILKLRRGKVSASYVSRILKREGRV